MTKKIVIPKETLPNLISGETDAFIRFRIVSGDRNRVSAWTPIFPVTPTIPYTNAIDTLQSDVATLQGEMTTAQGDITTIGGDIVTIEGDVTTLYALSDDNFAIGIVL